MEQNNNILQELDQLNSILAGKTIQNVYSVPVGYFEVFADNILNRIKALDAKSSSEELSYLSPMLNNISREMPYSVPGNYFETSADNIMQAVREHHDYQTSKEELETLSPFLSSLKKQTPYSVPNDYFENLNTQSFILSNSKTETKVVSIANQKWFRYAAAAVVTGILVLTGLTYIQKTNDPVRSFARFEKKLDKEIKTTSDKELTEFVQQFTDAGLSGDEKAQNSPKEEVKEMLKDVSDTELKEFIQETTDPAADGDNGSVLMN